MQEAQRYSVLMTVYEKEDQAFLGSSIDSILAQTLLPDQVVIVKDGPLTPGLEDTLASYITRYERLFKIIRIKENGGLGRALRIGLDSCTNELVARMDSDDMSVPERFEVQTSYMRKHPEIAVLGSWISEFESNPEKPYSIRNVPSGPDEVKKRARFRNPMNHMTVMFKKSAVLSVGSYQDFPWFEDYHLWARLLRGGFVLANIPQVLVRVRAGSVMIEKRRGAAYFRRELILQTEFLRMGFITKQTFLLNVLLRGLARMLPRKALLMLYKRCLRQSPDEIVG